jgi:hypothetical protein
MSLFHQTGDAMLQEPLLPTRNRGCGGVQQILNLLIRNSVRQQQDHTGSHHIARRKGPRLRHLLEFSSLIISQD